MHRHKGDNLTCLAQETLAKSQARRKVWEDAEEAKRAEIVRVAVQHSKERRIAGIDAPRLGDADRQRILEEALSKSKARRASPSTSSASVPRRTQFWLNRPSPYHSATLYTCTAHCVPCLQQCGEITCIDITQPR